VLRGQHEESPVEDHQRGHNRQSDHLLRRRRRQRRRHRYRGQQRRRAELQDEQAARPGIWAEGNDITLQNNTITEPVEDDGDGIRFFGNNIKILHNTVSGTSNQYGHADCMQTYSSDTAPSQNILIEGNRCEKIDNMCLMAEGPNDGEGDGKGHSDHFTLHDNFCETLQASQTIMMEDIQYATITDNEFAGSPDRRSVWTSDRRTPPSAATSSVLESDTRSGWIARPRRATTGRRPAAGRDSRN